MLYGSETPRIFTPPLRELTPETSLGFECIEFAQAVGVGLFPWERWFLIHALELLEDGSLRFRTLILLVARQNGKTTLLKILALYWMVVLGRLLVIGTAQDLDVAEETWADTVALAESSDEISPLIQQVVRQIGKKTLILETGERYKVKASTRRGARGLTGDLIEMDELREHQTWESWAAVSSTIMAVASALVVAASNAGDLSSVVLRQLRFMCMADPRTGGVSQQELDSFGQLPTAEDQPEDLSTDTVGIFEWSALPHCGLWDKAGWAAANPSLGYTISETAMATQARIASAGGEAEWVFRTENLCQWRPTGGAGPFPDGAWDAGLDKYSTVAGDSPLTACVDVSHDRGMAYVAVAGRRSDGHVHAEVMAMRAGTEWVVPWLTSAARPRWAAITAQTKGAPVSSLLEKPKDATSYQFARADDAPDGQPAVEVVEWSGPELAKASGQVWDLVRLPDEDIPGDETKRRLFHLPQPVLDLPATSAATRPLGDGWAIDRKKSGHDAAPLVAVFGAVWLLLQYKPPTRSAYEDSDLLVV